MLDLSHNQLGQDFNQGDWIKHISALTQLKVLLLHANQLKDEHCERIVKDYSNGLIYYLDLSQNQISNEGLGLLTEELPEPLKLLSVVRKDFKFTVPSAAKNCTFISVREAEAQDKFKQAFNINDKVSVLY